MEIEVLAHFSIPPSSLRVLSLKDGENRTRCIKSFKETFFARGIDGEQLKLHTAMATSLFSRCRAYLDPGAVNLSTQKHVFARFSLPPESHYESDCEETNPQLHYDNGIQSIGRTPQVHDVSLQSRQSYTPMANSVDEQTSNEYDTQCPSAEINDYGRTEFDHSAVPRTTSFQETSDLTRSDVPNFPENRSQGSILDHGDIPTTSPNSAGSLLETLSASAEHLECSPLSEPEQTQQTEPILGQSTLAIESARINQRKRKRNYTEDGM